MDANITKKYTTLSFSLKKNKNAISNSIGINVYNVRENAYGTINDNKNNASHVSPKQVPSFLTRRLHVFMIFAIIKNRFIQVHILVILEQVFFIFFFFDI